MSAGGILCSSVAAMIAARWVRSMLFGTSGRTHWCSEPPQPRYSSPLWQRLLRHSSHAVKRTLRWVFFSSPFASEIAARRCKLPKPANCELKGTHGGIGTTYRREDLLASNPFLILCYFVAYLDRVASASLVDDEQGHRALGVVVRLWRRHILPRVFPLRGAVKPVPGRFGARKWIARIMFTWGLLSGAMAFVVGESSFTCWGAAQVAEAGFFPGIIFYLTLWFPALYRARIIGYFMATIPSRP
jgi:hypothetical protein